MLKNYFKIAIAVLKRRKFFTFISLVRYQLYADDFAGAYRLYR
jgi:hypothetical protein